MDSVVLLVANLVLLLRLFVSFYVLVITWLQTQMAFSGPKVSLVAARGVNSLSMISEPHGGSLVNTLITDDAAKTKEIQSCDFEVRCLCLVCCCVSMLSPLYA